MLSGAILGALIGLWQGGLLIAVRGKRPTENEQTWL
jgi:hypothetical protein